MANSSPDEAGNLITCIIVSVYANALTYGKKYRVSSMAKNQVQVVGDNGRTRWFPTYCFDMSGADALAVVAIEVEDNVSEPFPVEITVLMSDGQKRWCRFATPEMLETVGDTLPDTNVRLHFGVNMIILTQLNEQLIKAAIMYLQDQGELLTHSLPYSDAESIQP